MKTVLRGSIFLFLTLAVYGLLRTPELIEWFFPTRSINVLVWPNIIDAEHFKPFEKATGIKVRLSFFENYEELLFKVQSGMGDYDLVMASDYAARALLKSGQVKQLDKKKLPFFNDLYPALLGFDFDRTNKYTLPYAWEIYGLGIDAKHYPNGLPEPTWALLFDPQLSPAQVGMLDDTREIISIVALYLFGKKSKTLSTEQLQRIASVLRAQKERVVMYTDLRTDYLLVSRSAPLVLGISSEIYNAIKHDDTIKFLVPKEGSFLLMDIWLIPKTTDKDSFVYQFLSYMYQKDVIKQYADRYSFFPARRGVSSDDNRYFIAPTKSLVNRLSLFDYKIPEKQMRELWITLKS